MEADIIITSDDSVDIVNRIEFERDPVCGEMIKQHEAKGISIFKNSKYYFCCPKCKEIFDKNPEIFIHGFHYELNYSETKPDKCDCESRIYN